MARDWLFRGRHDKKKIALLIPGILFVILATIVVIVHSANKTSVYYEQSASIDERQAELGMEAGIHSDNSVQAVDEETEEVNQFPEDLELPPLEGTHESVLENRNNVSYEGEEYIPRGLQSLVFKEANLQRMLRDASSALSETITLPLISRFGYENLDLFNKGFSLGKESFLQSKFIKAIVYDKKLTVSFIGQSQNNVPANESFPELFKTMFTPFLKASDVSLKVHSSLQPSLDQLSYEACLQSFVEPDSDIVFIDPPVMTQSRDLETLLRLLYRFPNQPAVAFVVPSSDRKILHDSKELEKMWFSFEDVDLRSYYKNTGFHTVFAAKIIEGKDWKDPMFGQESFLLPVEEKDQTFRWPDKNGHELFAFQLARNYAHQWMQALHSLAKLSLNPKGSLELDQKIKMHLFSTLSSKLPPAQACQGEDLCMIPLLPTCASAFEPRATNSGSIIELVERRGDWKLAVHAEFHDVLEQSRSLGYSYIPFALIGDNKSGTLSFSVNTKIDSSISVCQLRMKGKNLDLWDDKSVHVTVDGVVSSIVRSSSLCAQTAILPPGIHKMDISTDSSLSLSISHIFYY